MSRTEKLRRLSRRAVIESGRLERLAEALLNADVPYWSRNAKEAARHAYSMHIALTELAEAARDNRGAKRRSVPHPRAEGLGAE